MPSLDIATGLFALALLLILPDTARADGRPLSPAAQELLDRAFSGFEDARLVDHHVHMLGVGSGEEGTYANPRLFSAWHPVSKLKAAIFFKSAGISDVRNANAQYVERLLALAGGFPRPVRLAILAFDTVYDKDGRPDKGKSEFAVADQVVIDLARRHPDVFIPVASINPNDPGALSRLNRAADAGCRMVKWLPNAMDFDPSSQAFAPFYRLMAERGLILLTHTGVESSVASSAQEYGNPLLLRRALDNGVTVVMAHMGNRGTSPDLDNPGRRERNFVLALRMMDDPKYAGKLFADISALTQAIRDSRDIAVLLERTDLHDRLVNGSDYPLPALDVFISTRLLQYKGFITASDRRALDEIYRTNPLLFDFVLKRTLRHPSTKAGFNARVFNANPGLDLGPIQAKAAAATE